MAKLTRMGLSKLTESESIHTNFQRHCSNGQQVPNMFARSYTTKSTRLITLYMLMEARVALVLFERVLRERIAAALFAGGHGRGHEFDGLGGRILHRGRAQTRDDGYGAGRSKDRSMTAKFDRAPSLRDWSELGTNTQSRGTYAAAQNRKHRPRAQPRAK